MKPTLIGLFVCIGIAMSLQAQKIYFPDLNRTDSMGWAKSIQKLSGLLIEKYKNDNQRNFLDNLFRLQFLSDQYSKAIATIALLRDLSNETDPAVKKLLYIQHELYAKARIKEKEEGVIFNVAYSQLFNELFKSLSEKEAVEIYTAFLTRNGVEDLRNIFQTSLVDRDSLSMSEAINITRNYYVYDAYKNFEVIAKNLIKEDDDRRYIIDDSVLIRTNYGVVLSAIVVRKRNQYTQQPATLYFTIYSDPARGLAEAKQAAARGFVGIVADARGKRLSTDEIRPYEAEVKDVNAVIDWVSKQSWSNGKVGMYGGSYTGFAQWAATKRMHPALKTIVPYVAAMPGLGLPMENNVFLNANYGWAFYVTNNRYLDNDTYYQTDRWNSLNDKWYTSGVSYRKIDSVDQAPNKWLQRWLQHPSFDNYWQEMIPYKKDFSKISIPVLTITGYYDDGQVSAIHYLKEHYKYNNEANHYMIIGPYDHFGAQRGGIPVLRDYAVDPVALINVREITFEWMNHVMNNGSKPSLIKDKINYEVMGANEWRHVPSLEKAHNEIRVFYLTDIKAGNYYKLDTRKTGDDRFITQEVDLADRTTSNNTDYYPFPIISETLGDSSGLFFISDPIDHPFSINGIFEGELKATINKKDMDIGVVLYELLPDGRFFHLSYYLGRASYAKDMTTRKLLRPGLKETIHFDRTRMVSRQLEKGSRLLVVLNINRNPFAQVNYGTGKDVSDETINDAKESLKIKWHTDSFIKIPVWK